MGQECQSPSFCSACICTVLELLNISLLWWCLSAFLTISYSRQHLCSKLVNPFVICSFSFSTFSFFRLWKRVNEINWQKILWSNTVLLVACRSPPAPEELACSFWAPTQPLSPLWLQQVQLPGFPFLLWFLVPAPALGVRVVRWGCKHHRESEPGCPCCDAHTARAAGMEAMPLMLHAWLRDPSCLHCPCSEGNLWGAVPHYPGQPWSKLPIYFVWPLT